MKTKTLKRLLSLALFLLATLNLSAVVLTDTATTSVSVAETYAYQNLVWPGTTSTTIDAYCAPGDDSAMGHTMWIVAGTGMALDLTVTSTSGLQTGSQKVSNVPFPYGQCWIIHVGRCEGTGASTASLRTVFTW